MIIIKIFVCPWKNKERFIIYNAIYAFVWIFALWKWGDLKQWKKYYPTFLFFLIGDFIYLYLLSDRFPMWKYTPQSIDKGMGLTNSHIVFSVMAVKYPITLLLYLSHYPEGNLFRQAAYIAFWVVLYAINEGADLLMHLIKYYNGWSLWWSTLLNTVMFSMLRIHYLRPWLAWVLSLAFIVFLWMVFDVPSSVFR